jgi:hypothetical protein
VGPDGLVDVTLDDLDWIADVSETWQRSYRWSLRGRSPTPDLVGGLVFHDVELQSVAITDRRAPIGLLQVSEVNAESGYGRLDLLVDGGHRDALREPLAGFVAGALRRLALRKLCLQAVDGELDVEAHLAGSACTVGRLVGHERRGDDEYADLLVYEIWRHDHRLDDLSTHRPTGGTT